MVRTETNFLDDMHNIHIGEERWSSRKISALGCCDVCGIMATMTHALIQISQRTTLGHA